MRGWFFGLAGLLAPSSVLAAPIELVEERDGFWVFDDIDQTVENANWFSRDPFLAAYDEVETGFLAVHPDDSQFLIVYTTWSLPGGIGAFYQSVANDVHGIGFEHIAPEDAVIPEPYFDDTPNSQVQGFLHMNRWSQYLGRDRGGVDDSKISLIFGQELGHAWLSFVYYDQGDGEETNLLGRSNAHWSFYMHSGGSPVQGHDWVDNADGTFTAMPTDLFRYADIDLYLMGLLPPEEVEPWFVLENPTNCVDSALPGGDCASDDGFQFQAPTYTITADRRDVTVDDVIAVEGARDPSYPSAPDTFDISFLLIKRPDESPSEEDLQALHTIVDRSIQLWEDEQTRGLGDIINRTAFEQPDETTGGTGGSGGEGGSSTGASTATGSGAEAGTSSTAGSSPDGDGSTGGSGDTDDGEMAADGEGGCGCGQARPAWSGFSTLLLLGLWRRRDAKPANAHASSM